MRLHTALPDPVAILLGAPSWAGRAEALLADQGMELLRVSGQDTAQIIDLLIARWPALVIVDSSREPWRDWVTAIKTEQATRRIPVLVIGEESIRPAAAAAGANAVLSPAEVDRAFAPWVQAHARRIDPAMIATLDCECNRELPPLARQGVEKFNAGAYYAQHDAFEAQWMAETGPVRELYRAILQVGVAYYHIQHGNANGGLKLLRRSVQWFALMPDVCQGIDVRQLRADADQVRAALQAMDPAGIATFDTALFRPIRLVDPASLRD